MAGKPPAEIDLKQLEGIAKFHCTIDEAAVFFGCSKRTMLRYLDEENRDPAYREAWERGRTNGKLSLRRLQWQHASGTGSSAVQMTIHLSKHWLGETEKSLLELSGPDGGPIETKDVSPVNRIRSRIAGLAARSGAGEGSGGADGE